MDGGRPRLPSAEIATLRPGLHSELARDDVMQVF